MGIIFTILIGLVAIALFCVLMDLITWLYSIAWIIPVIILGVFFIRLIFRPDFRTKVVAIILGQRRSKGNTPHSTIVARNKSFEQLNDMIDIALVNGIISAKERRTIIEKGLAMGFEPKVVEAHIESRLSKLK